MTAPTLTPEERCEMAVADLDQLRTEMHERAVRATATAWGDDPDKALTESRALRVWALGRGLDLRMAIPKARRQIEQPRGGRR